MTQASTPSYPTTPIVDKGELPDLFALDGGGRVATPEQWPARAAAWRELVVQTMYGGMPPAPEAVELEVLCRHHRKAWPGRPRNWSYRVHCTGGDKPFAFVARVVAPTGDGPYPAIIHGDGCWWPPSEQVVEQVLAQGCALVLFNRTEMAEDRGTVDAGAEPPRAGGLYDVYPGHTFGALAAWAWGYHRCVDLLHQLPFIDHDRIASTGHSRGGKASLLAGATDDRLTLVNDNGSCAGGSAAFRYVGDGGETLDIVNQFTSWFGPAIRGLHDREQDVPFDQHCLLATVAPRPLLLTYALDDRWSNPEGMVQSAWAAAEVYRFLGVADRLAFHLRPGGHRHAPEDWQVLLDFIAWHWQGGAPTAAYNQHPYAHLRPAFTWRAPA